MAAMLVSLLIGLVLIYPIYSVVSPADPSTMTLAGWISITLGVLLFAWGCKVAWERRSYDGSEPFPKLVKLYIWVGIAGWFGYFGIMLVHFGEGLKEADRMIAAESALP